MTLLLLWKITVIIISSHPIACTHTPTTSHREISTLTEDTWSKKLQLDQEEFTKTLDVPVLE